MGTNLTADFYGANAGGFACTVILQPDNPLHQGDTLKALLRTAHRNYRHVQLVLDDVACAETVEEANIITQQWLDEYREKIDDWGFSLERMRRISGMRFNFPATQELTEACTSNPFLSSLAGGGNEGELSPILRRLAGYMATNMDYGRPVVGAEELNLSKTVLGRLSETLGKRGMYSLPEMVRVSFREVQDAAKPALPAPIEKSVPAVQPESNVIQLFPRR